MFRSLAALPLRSSMLLFAGAPWALAGEEDPCYTCAASACYGHYEHRLETLRRDTTETVKGHEAAYVALDREANPAQGERLLAARAEALDAEQARIKVLYDELLACLSDGAAE